MKSFHKTMAVLAVLFVIMILLSVTAAVAYIQRNQIRFSDLINENLNFSTSSLEFTTDHLLTPNVSSGRFETKIVNESTTYDLKEELFISASSEELQFIEEDRDTIQIDYYREYPNTDRYQFDYTVDTTENKLNIHSTLSVNNLNINQEYKSSITIHVPMNYRFKSLTIDTAMAKITSETIYTNADDLSILCNFGDVEIRIDDEINHLNVTSTLGNIAIKTNRSINSYDISADMGDISIAINEDAKDVQIHASMGNISGSFYQNVAKINAHTNMGNIDLSFSENSSMLVYAKSNLGSVTSIFEQTESQSMSYFVFTTDIGDIELKKNPTGLR